MKQVVIISLVLIIKILSYGQTKIEGIGVFKLGRTSHDVFLDLDMANVEHTPFSKMTQKELSMLLIYEPTHCADVKRHYIKNYSISGITLPTIAIFFYKDSLYKIEIMENSTSLYEPINMVYGAGIETYEKTKTNCVYTYTGNKIEKEGYVRTITWRDDNIHSYALSESYYNNECKPSYISYLYTYDKDKSRTINSCDSLYRAMQKKENEAKKIEKYKDFN